MYTAIIIIIARSIVPYTDAVVSDTFNSVITVNSNLTHLLLATCIFCVVYLTMTLLTLRLIIVSLSQLLTFQEATLTMNQVIVSVNNSQ
jgi:hypothetical protein